MPTTIVQSGARLAPTDHPRNSAVIRAALERDGVTVRTGVRAIGARASAGEDGAHVIDLDDGSTVEGHAILLAVGRAFPLDDLGLEHYGLDATGGTPYPRDGRLRVADGLFIVGDAAGLATMDMGEGIGPAVESGILAANAIIHRTPYSLKAIARFSLWNILLPWRW